MWRSLQLIAPKSTVQQGVKLPRCFYATNQPSGKGKKTVTSVVAVAGITVGATIIYAKYDPKFRKIIEENVPYSDIVFKSIPDFQSSTAVTPKSETIPSEKAKEAAIESGLLKKKQEREKQKKEEKPNLIESKTQDSREQKGDPESEKVKAREAIDESQQFVESSRIIVKKSVQSNHGENAIKNYANEIEASTKQAVIAGESAIEAIKLHAAKLYQALETPEGMDNNENWKQADLASSEETNQRNLANEKLTEVKTLIEKLRTEIKKCDESGSKSPVVKSGIETVKKAESELKQVEEKLSAAYDKSRTAKEYKDLVEKARNQFRNELKIVLPKYVHKKKDQSMTEDELNLLVAHAHRRIEALQKEIAKYQVTEKQKIEVAKMMQKVEDVKSFDAKIETEVAAKQRIIEAEYQKQLDILREQFEADMRKQLRRQAAAHADHLQEALYVQHQEMSKRQNRLLEEKLLQQKGVFISEISQSMAQLKGIEHYLKARAELDESTQRVQALWLACQAMKNTIHSGFSEAPKPLGKELAVVKAAAGEGSSFVNTVLAGIPSQAIQRGIYTNENLKQRFDRVKKICQRVAMVEGNNRSLFSYALSYMQSFLIIDTASIPKEEIEGKVDVDPSQLDTFDILSRVSYCLQRNDLTRALYYANNLKGEPYNVARDWITEVKLLLETSQAINCLITYAAAIDVQANH